MDANQLLVLASYTGRSGYENQFNKIVESEQNAIQKLLESKPFPVVSEKIKPLTESFDRFRSQAEIIFDLSRNNELKMAISLLESFPFYLKQASFNEETKLFVKEANGALEEISRQQESSLHFNSVLSLFIGFSLVLMLALSIGKIAYFQKQLIDQNQRLDDLVVEKTKQLKEEHSKYLHTSRLAIVGEMTSNIAHEINNPLTVILSSATLARNRLSDPEEAKLRLDKIVAMTERITKIVRNMKAMGHNSDENLKEFVDVESLIRNSVDLSSNKTSNLGVKLTSDLDSHLPKILCNSTQVEQVLVNLISNSCDAIYKQPDPWIRIVVRNRDDSIIFYVIDSGTGIPITYRDKILQPFFTSKPKGIGLGLGLSLCKQLIESQGGKFAIDFDAPNTTFFFSIPVKEEKNSIKEA